MTKVGKLLWTIGVVALLTPRVARADGFKSYHICGGDKFTTCAAVQISVVGKNVTVNIWNLSGNTNANNGIQSNGNTVFNGIGFYHLPPGVKIVSKSVSANGPFGANGQPGRWKFKNNGKVAFPVGIAGRSGGKLANGVASGCGTVPPKTKLFVNGCTSPTNGGWVTYHFKIKGNWDPNQSDIVLRGIQRFPGGKKLATECWTGTNPSGGVSNCTTVTPEPVTLTLLASGLAGMSGAGLLRRRRKGVPTG